MDGLRQGLLSWMESSQGARESIFVGRIEGMFRPHARELVYPALIFALPPSSEAQASIQARFLTEPSFWSPWVARLRLWTRPVAVSKTETPDGQAALLLIVMPCEELELLERVGYEMAETLGVPAFALTSVGVDAEMRREMKDAPRPWEMPSSPQGRLS